MLRVYQFNLDCQIDNAYLEDARNVMATMATGGGKAVVIGHRLRKLDAPAVVMAHRSQLVSQLALTLNREQVPHGVFAPDELIRQIIKLEVDTHGKSFYRAQAPVRVASTKTFAGRDAKDRWYKQVAEAVVDEGHHAVKGSEIERALSLVPNARGLFMTAHAIRGDGKGLGRKADGLIDALVVGPCARELMDQGYLCDYDIACPESDIDVSDIPIGASGEMVFKKLAERVHASKMLVGSIVDQYIAKAGGKLGLTFVIDIEEAHKTSAEYRKRGVPTEIITQETSIAQRADIMRRFERRQLLQVVSVDVLSEGVDVPAVEVISLGRHTESFQTFAQQVGRGSRPLIVIPEVWARWGEYDDAGRLAHIAASPKPKFLILDHVGNFNRMYLKRGTTFEQRQSYTLGRVERRAKTPTDVIPLRTCTNELCFKPYPTILLKCPHCQAPRPEPESRGSPDKVEGDLAMLDLVVLRAMQSEISRIDGPASYPSGIAPIIAAAIMKKHHQRQVAQGPLRQAIALWAGWQQQIHKLEDREIQRLFYYRFAVDIGTAQTLGMREAAELEQLIRDQLARYNIVQAEG